jgi:ATP-dependent helicase HrpB
LKSKVARKSFSYILDLTIKMATQQRLLTALPIDARMEEIRKSVNDFSNVIILAEPGAGKSTRVPPALMENSKWIMLQPRRWAAKQVAKRIAEEQGVVLGEEVGYQVRFDSKTSAKTKLTILTEGILLRKLVQDPELTGITGIILDEFHERSLDLDLALAMLKEIQDSLRPDLKIIVMSATLDPTALEKYLPDVCTIKVEGRTFPVEKKYLGEVRVSTAVSQALEEVDGDVLVFLPGAFEIERAVRDISEQNSGNRNLEVLPLYSSLTDAEQKRIFEPSTKRRVICATNIAETSITLPKIKAVVDSGWGKVMRTDPQMGEDRLETLRISRASSEQRAGRAGRVSAGICYRLWTEGEQGQLRNFETPEVHRVNLSKAILFLADYGVTNFQKFTWFELPKSSMLDWALRELEQFQFLKKGKITERGRLALRFPLSPKFAQMVLVADAHGKKEFAARICAYLENRPAMDEVEDEGVLIRKLNQLGGSAKLSAEQIFGTNGGVPMLSSDEMELFQKILIEAWPDQVFIENRRVGRRRVVSKKGALPRFGFILSSMEKLEKGSPQIEVRSFIPLDEKIILYHTQKRKNEFWDESLEKVRAQEGLFFQDIEIGELREAQAEPSRAGIVLKEYILKKPIEIFNRQERFAHWYERVQFYNSTRKPEENKMEWSWGDVLESLGSGKTKLTQILEEPVVDYIEGMLDSGFVQRFQESVPAKIEVPSGSSHKIDYSTDIPKLSVRLQEVFGWLETPKIADGRKGLLMELLSPGFKPIQLTSDLKSFWSNAYFEVRKELKIRYPKHSWPEDPLTAKAEAKGRRRF